MDKHKEALNEVIEYCNSLIYSHQGCECNETISTKIIQIIDESLGSK